MPNVKRAPRTTFLALAKVRDLATSTDIGYVGNISTNGFMMYANGALPPRSRRILSIRFPHPTRGDVAVDVGVRVAWQRPDSDKPKQQTTGCEIVAIEPTDRLALLQAAKAYGVAA